MDLIFVFLFIFEVVFAFLVALLLHINFRIILVYGCKEIDCYDRCIKLPLKPYVLLLYCLATTPYNGCCREKFG